MSADNYYVVRRHPAGGFAAVMGFASDVDDHGDEVMPEVDPTQNAPFATVGAAVAWAMNEYTEYGVSVHPECESDTGEPR